jgi:Xaa-Pro aminopeptidase
MSAIRAAGRLERVAAGLDAAACDAGVFVGATHAAHLAGYSRYGSGPVAVVIGDAGRTLVVPAYEVERATENADVDRVLPYGGTGFGLDLDTLPKLAAVAREAAGSGRIGVASEIPGLAEAIAGGDHADLSGLVHDIRLQKDDDEIEAIRASYGLALAGQAAVERLAREGAREIDLFTAAHAEAQALAVRPVQFVSDMLSGAETADVCCPVRVPGDRRLGADDVVLADVAVADGGYWGDSARTFVVGRNAEIEEARAGISAILADTAPLLRAGAVCADIFAHMRDAILGRFPEGAFPHHGGHGVGVTVFEDPHLIPADRTQLLPGMVLAVEPGVYFEGRFGVRVERMYVVTDAGGRDLTA